MTDIKSKNFHSRHISVSLIVKRAWERLRSPTFHGFSLFLGPKGDKLGPGLQGPREGGSERPAPQEGEGTQVWRSEAATVMGETWEGHTESGGHKETGAGRPGKWDGEAGR